MARLKAFTVDRAKTDTASTSRLSPHVHYGEISVRHIYYVVRVVFNLVQCVLGRGCSRMLISRITTWSRYSRQQYTLLGLVLLDNLGIS